MNEEERAGWLARAVDKLIQRQKAVEPPGYLEDPDIEGLLQIAKARLELAESNARMGLLHEGTVWRKLLERLDRETAATAIPSTPSFFLRTVSSAAGGPDPADQELQELEDIIALRRRMSAQSMALAEAHRDAVWNRVRSRLSARESRMGFFSFLRRNRSDGWPAPGGDPLATGPTTWHSTRSDADELVDIARRRAVRASMARSARTVSWQHLTVGAAVLILIVAAVGPIPETGLAGHPVARFIEGVGDHVGVAESRPPPTDTGVPVVIEGTPVTAAEASDLLGLALSEPTTLPADFHLAASLFYADGLSGSGGTFLLSYKSGDIAILVFQEAAPASDLGVYWGSPRDMTLADGTPATYFAGGWVPGNAGFTWATGGARSLVFDRSGVRTIIQYVGDDARAPDLAAVASGLR